MAFKFAFIAALCIAQAFALPLIDDDEEVGDYDIFVKCFGDQREHLEVIEGRLNKIGAEVLSYLKGEMRERAEKYIKQMEEPVAKIGKAILELHSNVHGQLKEEHLPEAAAALTSGIGNVREVYASIRQQLKQFGEEDPELLDTMNYMFRYLVFELEVFFPRIRRTFAQCLIEGRTEPYN